MSALGAYEIRSEIGRSRGATVFRVTKLGEATREFAAKVFSLRPYLEAEETETETELAPLVQGLDGSFKQSYTLQQQAAVTGAHVVPVIEAGRSPQGEWFVAPFYSESVQSLIRRKVRLDHAQIHHLVHGVVLGAQEFKGSVGRGHGNLKPTNIFLDTRGRLKSDREVFVADPAAGGAGDAARIERADLRAIGALIFSLVRRAAVDDFAYNNLPREVDGDWRERFGKQAEAWLELTRLLLNPSTSASEMDLDKLLVRLRGLRPGGHGGLFVGLGIAALIVVVLLVYLIFGGLHIEISNMAEVAASNEGKGKVTLKLNGIDQSGGLDAKGRMHVRWMFGGAEVESTARGYKRSTNTVAHVGFRRRLVVTLQELTMPVRVTAVAPGEIKITMNGAPVAGPFPREVDVPIGRPIEFKAQHRASTKTEKIEPLRPGDEVAPVNFNFNPGNFLVRVQGVSAAAYSGIVGRLKGEGVDLTIRGTNIFTFPNLSADRYELTVSNRFNETAKLSIDLRDEAALSSGAQTNVTLQPGRAQLQFKGNREGMKFEFAAFDPNTHHSTNQLREAGTYDVVAGTNFVVASLSNSVAVWPSVTNMIVLETGETQTWDCRFVGGSISLAGTTPANASIMLHGGGRAVTNQGRLDAVSDLPPGSYQIRVALEKYDDWQTSVILRTNQTVQLPAVELLEASGRIAWSVNLAGADLTLTGKNLEGAEVTRKLSGLSGMERLDPGQYRVAASYPNSKTVGAVTSEVLTVAKRGTNYAPLVLQYWVGSFDSDPRGAAVKVGGQELGLSPVKERVFGLSETSIEFGPVTLNETNKYLGTNWTLAVSVGQTNRLNVKLAKAPLGPPRYKNPLGMEFLWVTNVPASPNGGAWVGKYEVTEGEWARVMGTGGKVDSKMPVVFVSPILGSPKPVPAFLKKLAANDGNKNYRLPSKEQWLVLRDPDPVANLSLAVVGDKDIRKAGAANAEPVGTSNETNRLGLFDVIGNVSELVDEKAPTCMGFSWSETFINATAFRDEGNAALLLGSETMNGANNIGFRVFLFEPKAIRNDSGQ